MAKFAIKGHATRGNEVIEILEMLGGKDDRKYGGSETEYVYFINEHGIIDWALLHYDLLLFPLEEFLELYPFKIGDKVLINKDVNDVYTVKSMEWDECFNRVAYKIEAVDGIMNNHTWFAHEMVFFNIKKEEIMEEKIESFEILESHCANEVKIEFDPSKFEIVKRDEGYYVVKKQPQYPKTYVECCEILYPNENFQTVAQPIKGHNGQKLFALQKLLICRDAYWKIAGEHMGLGKPWEPSANDEGKTRSLYYNRHRDCIDKCEGLFESNTILDFPTKEMRDVFYENFKDLIKNCKELL